MIKKIQIILAMSFAFSAAAVNAQATNEASMTMEFTNKKNAQEALKQAKEVIVGDTIKDAGGCLYYVSAKGKQLVLVPVIVEGVRICSDKGVSK
jgi:hypothetical protein